MYLDLALSWINVQVDGFGIFPVLQYTEKEGLRLGLVGWVKNTSSGTVVGQVQGPADMVEEM